MAIKVTCPECFRDYQIPDQYAGKKVKCKGCGAAIRVEEDPDLEDPSTASLAQTSMFPSSPPPRAGSKPAVAKRKPKSSSGNNATKWILGILGGGLAVILLCCGGAGLWVRNAFNEAIEQQAGTIDVYADLPDFGAPESLFPVAQIPVPQFPELGEGIPLEGTQIAIYNVDLGSIPANTGSPGMQMTMRVYVPPGDHAPQSLPAVLVAPAGTTLLTGMALDDSEYHDETLPYAEAGMVVIHYSLDGDEFEEGGDETVTYPYALFRAACAGVVNARNALEFARARLPMVNPNKVYAAGHSSAGTLALLAAEHEPRLAGAIAYAPATDVESRLSEMADVPFMEVLYPKLKEFVTQSSPDTHVADLKTPVFLFHARDDSNVPFADSQTFADALKNQGKDVTFESSPTGDHYDSMVSDGIPKAIEWLKPRAGI